MATGKSVSCLQASFVYLTGGKRSRIGLRTNRQCLWQTICGGILRIWYVLRCGVLGLSTTKRGRKLRLSVHERRGILKVSICNRRRQLRDVLRLGALSIR